ncbi:MAG: AAA family ATPase [Candidatus Methanofastidiosa archaeon]|nr:AAA family ATPase [Candidatus Methanofastidiosa archaeon]
MMEKLEPERLRHYCDPLSIDCRSTADLSPIADIIGQERAVRVLKFGLEMRGEGFNIYVSGRSGTGRMTAVKDFLEKVSSKEKVPSDWCYVNNFKDQYEPNVIELPPGQGEVFSKEMEKFIGEAKRMLPEAFESDDYADRRDATIRSSENERNKLFEDLNVMASKRGFAIQRSPMGFMTIPIIDGKPISEQDFMALSQDVRLEIQKKREEVTEELRVAMRKLKNIDEKINDDLKELNRKVALFTIGNLVQDLKEEFKDHEDVIKYIESVQEDILENIIQFITLSKPPQDAPMQQMPWQKELPFRKYEVNVLVGNSATDGAPVIVELNPTYQNLFGKLEKEAQFGMLITDFTMIRGGAIHKANGGYLVLPVEDLLKNPISWEGLKIALKQGLATIEEPGEKFGYISTRGMKPAPIPLKIKVVLIGSPQIYEALYSADPSFKELFKIKADFDNTMRRNKENINDYSKFVCTICEKEGLNHLSSESLAKLIEYSSRISDHKDKLSTQFATIADIIREADFYSKKDGLETIGATHIEKAISEKIFRSSLFEEKLQEMFDKGQILVDVEGSKVGQVNGLSVMSMGDYSFGRPSRVTASTGVGKSGVIDIEKEVEMGGPIHSKGVMILVGYLLNQYARNKPLELSARLVFEQSYSGVEGDSASSTELYSILSSLSGAPISQGIAVTGSVNQLGEVQPIGGVNEKIEGHFSVCKSKGLNGEQGVMIPASNVQNLMLKEEVVGAVREGKFHIYAVSTIDEGIEVLTGLKAGKRNDNGTYEEGGIHYLVDKRLSEIAEAMKTYPWG